MCYEDHSLALTADLGLNGIKSLLFVWGIPLTTLTRTYEPIEERLQTFWLSCFTRMYFLESNIIT